jgi:calcium permeable stress-gated cation channel
VVCSVRYVVVSAVTAFLVLFWTVPIAFISAFIQLESLEKQFPGIGASLQNQPTLKAFLSGFLSQILYVVFQLLLPTILDALARTEGVRGEASIQRWVLRRYFYFMVINFFFGIILTGSFFAVCIAPHGSRRFAWRLIALPSFSRAQILDDLSPGRLPQRLGTAVPSVSTFFICYILLRTLAGWPLFMLRPGAFIVSNFLKCLAGSKRATHYALDWARYWFYFGVRQPSATHSCVCLALTVRPPPPVCAVVLS